MAESLKLPSKKGAFVTAITPGGPADKARIKVGDIITKLNGQPIKDNTELTRRVAVAHVGEDLHLDIIRAGQPMTLTVRSGVRPSEEELAQRDGSKDDEAKPQPAPPTGAAVLGMTVAPLDAEARARFHLDADATGVVITGTVPHTPAAKRGLKAGDLVVMADSRPVTGVADFEADVNAVKASGRPSVLLLVQREGRNSPVPIPFDSAAK
jgi:serine protease Do